MPIGPTLIFDKSTLQSLKIEEAEWLSHHLHANLVSPLYIEIAGVLTASDRKDPIADLASLARKALGMGLTTTPNMRHEHLEIGNLMGFQFEMDGRIVLDGVERIVQPDGRVILFQDEPHEIKALRRWARGEVTERELKGAALHREFIEKIDLPSFAEVFGDIPASRLPESLGEALALADKVIDGKGRYDALRRAMRWLHVPDKSRGGVVKRWKQMGRPTLRVCPGTLSGIA